MRKSLVSICSIFLLLLTACVAHDNPIPLPSDSSVEDEGIAPTPIFENIIHTYEVNENETIVQTQKESYAPKYELWNKKTNQVDTFPTMPDIVELQEINSSDYFVFLTSGQGSESSRLEFPHMINCFKTESDDEPFIRIDEDKRFDLSETVCAGSEITCVLSAINFSFDSVSFMFAPYLDNEAAFYADAPDIPLTKITYEETTHTLSISLSSCFVPETAVVVDKCLAENPYIKDYQIQQHIDGTIISFVLSDAASGYFATKDVSFEPFFTLRFSR